MAGSNRKYTEKGVDDHPHFCLVSIHRSEMTATIVRRKVEAAIEKDEMDWRKADRWRLEYSLCVYG